jgi:holin-like protein
LHPIYDNVIHNIILQSIMVRQCTILFGCLAFGELLVWLTGINLPGSIIGMLMLTALLHFKVVNIESVKGISDFLISNLGFFFIPPGVALMLYFDIIKAELAPIVIATAVSTVVVLVTTGWTHQFMRRHHAETEE